MNKQKNLRTVSIFEQYLMMTVGIVLMVMGFYYFIIPADLVTGGVTGIGLVINKLSNIKISYIVFAFNILLLFVGLFMLGKKTFYKKSMT